MTDTPIAPVTETTDDTVIPVVKQTSEETPYVEETLEETTPQEEIDPLKPYINVPPRQPEPPVDPPVELPFDPENPTPNIYVEPTPEPGPTPIIDQEPLMDDIIIKEKGVSPQVSSLYINGNISSDLDTNKKNQSIIHVVIDNIAYVMKFENDNAASSFVKLLPKDYIMNDMNGNKKYVEFMDYVPRIDNYYTYMNSGSVVLCDNKLMIIYKSINENMFCTKLGQIIGLPDLGNAASMVRFEKE